MGQGDQGSRHRAAVGRQALPHIVKFVGIVLATLVALLAPLGVAAAQDAKFPSRAVTFVVPFPPGGSADALPRIVAEKLRERWGQPVIIENRPGAAGSTGSGSVFRSAPDGYTLLATPAGPLAINGLVQKTLPYDAGGVRPGRAAGAVADRADGAAEFSGEHRRGVHPPMPRPIPAS